MPGYNKSLSKLSPPVSPPKEIERIITDIYDTLNNLSGDTLTAQSQNITLRTVSSGISSTLTHPNTSGQSSVDNSNGSVIQDVTLDNFGHVTSLASTDLDSRYITGITAGAGLTGGGTSGAVTVSHSDTSSQASVNNSNGSVIQDVTIDTYGHVTGLSSTDLDSRYLRLSAGGAIQDAVSIDTSSASSGNILRLLGSGQADIEFSHVGNAMTFTKGGTIETTGTASSDDLNLISAKRVTIDANDGLNVDANITCTSDISASNLSVSKVTASTGILFGSDTAAANTLDDYEEGTWTPVYGSTVANVTSSTYDSGVTFGQYTKIGDTVHLWGRIRTDQIFWSSSSGSVFITGIPFSANNVIGDDVLTYAGSIAYANNWLGEHPMHLGIVGGSNNRIFLYYQEIHFDSNNGGYLNISPLDTNSGTDGNDLVFQITYKV